MAAVQKPPSKSSQPAPPRRRSARFSWGSRPLFVLLLVVTLLYGIGLGSTDFWAPDEPRYGAIAEELRSFRHGARGLVLLHLNDEAYTQKPPLYFWLAAATGASRGVVDEWSARLPSAIAGILSVALTVWVGRALFRRSMPAILAAGLLATSFRFAFSARRIQLDVLLTLFELAAVACFLFLETRRQGVENARRSPLWIAAFHASLGAAALTKGPVGWLPLLIIAAYLAWEGRLRAFRAIVPVWSWTLSLAPITIWIVAAVALAPSGFADTAVVENLFGRFFLGTSHARPFYFFAYQLPLDFLPWSLLLPLALAAVWRLTRRPEARSERVWDEHAAARFLFVWLVVPLIFFSLSAGKRGLYLLPVFPALSIACVLVGRGTGRWPSLSPKGLRSFGLAITLVWAIEVALFTLVLPLLETEKSPRPIAEATAVYTRPDEPVGIFAMRPMEGAIAYYGHRSVASLRTESELRDFLDADGRLVVLRARHLRELGPGLHLREVKSFRSGDRRVSLARRAQASSRREDDGATAASRP